MKSESNKLLISTVKKLLHRHGKAQLQNIIDRTHPADLALVLNFLTRAERREFFGLCKDPELAASLLCEVEQGVLRELLEQIEDRRLVRLLELMSSDDTADVLAAIEDEARKELLLTMMRRDELVTTQSLLGFHPESAGGLMVPDYFALEEQTTAGEAVRRLQEDAGRTEMVFYIYVVNTHNHLVGVTSLRELVLARPETPLAEFVTSEVIRVHVDTDQEEVARLIARYNLVALPVVDEGNVLVGVVTVDDIIDVIRAEATEDILLMAGAGEDRVEGYGSITSSLRARLPWLMPGFAGGLLAMLVIRAHELHLIRVAALAMFLPIMMIMGGNVGTQSSTIVTRGLALGRAPFAELGRVVVSELAVGVFAGLLYGALMGLITRVVFAGSTALLVTGVTRFSLAVSVSLASAMALAAFLGALIPMVFSRVNIDPAIATGPFVTTLVDVISIVAYLVIASSILA